MLTQQTLQTASLRKISVMALLDVLISVLSESTATNVASVSNVPQPLSEYVRDLTKEVHTLDSLVVKILPDLEFGESSQIINR